VGHSVLDATVWEAIVDSDADEATAAELTALLRVLEQGRNKKVGFAVPDPTDYVPLAPFFGHELHHVGDSPLAPDVGHHTEAMEREVVEFMADLFRAPPDDRWGYLTHGGSEGTIFGLYAARSVYPDGLVYLSDSAPPGARRAADLLGLDTVTIRVTDGGELDYDDLRAELDRHRVRPAIVVATIGAPPTEAVDDVGRIKQILRELALANHYVHSDVTRTGVAMALLDEQSAFNLSEGSDSLNVNGDTFLHAPLPCGIVMLRRTLKERISRTAFGDDSPEATISGTRNGHAALLLWYALRRHGLAGLRNRARQARELAEYLVRELTELGWPARRQPHALTVRLKSPPAELANRWRLVDHDGWTRVTCQPGTTRDHVDRFLAELVKLRVPARSAGRKRMRSPLRATAA
jgi:histidine decarboxylase